MATRNAINLSATSNADGYDLSGGTTARKLTVTGADITLTGSGTAVYTFPGSTDTVVTLAANQALTNKTYNGNTWTAGTGVLTFVAGKTLTVNKTLTLDGTDSTTMTFPTTSATIARTDAANTFTGHQTIEGVTSTGATGTGKFVFDGTPTIATPSLTSPTLTGTPVLDSTSAIPFYSDHLFRQALINGGFDIWQRGTTVTMTTADAYTADRWYCDSATAGDDKTVTRQTAVNNGTRYSCRVQRPNGQSTTTVIRLSQALETSDSIKFRGQKLTLSFYVKAGANFSASSSNLVIKIVTGKGTDQKLNAFTTSADAATLTQAITTTSTFFSVTTGSVIASDITQIGVSFSFTPTGTAGADDWFEVEQVQLNIGTIALPYYSRHFVTELLMCQRFYETGQVEFNGYDAAGQACAQQCRWKVTKRGTPVVGQTNAAAVNCGTGTNQNVITVDGFQSYRVVTALGHAQYSESWTSDAEF